MTSELANGGKPFKSEMRHHFRFAGFLRLAEVFKVILCLIQDLFRVCLRFFIP